MGHATEIPTVTVEIGGLRREYHAFVTTARPVFDGPSTLTLYTSHVADVAGFAATRIRFSRALGRTRARIVLVDATELEWHHAAYGAGRGLLAPVDTRRLGEQTLQRWLWQRLTAAGSLEPCG